MGVVFARMGEEDKVLGIARNSERDLKTVDEESSVLEVSSGEEEKETTE